MSGKYTKWHENIDPNAPTMFASRSREAAVLKFRGNPCSALAESLLMRFNSLFCFAGKSYATLCYNTRI